MSSTLLIALSISDQQVTAALVRVESADDPTLTIERETSFTRTYRIEAESKPREIIAIWMQCIEDLLHESLEHWQDKDTLAGITVGHHFSSFRPFAGLNLRYSFQSGLRELVNRWKKNFKELPAKTQLTPTEGSSGKENVVLRRAAKDFCGGLDDEDARSSISHSRRNTYFHDVPPETSPATRRFSLIEQLTSLPLTFHNSVTCLALGELTYEQNQGYERILALNLGTSFDSAFLDRGEVIVQRDDVPPEGSLSQCPYDQNSSADDWFSTRGLLRVYQKLFRPGSSALIEDPAMFFNALVRGATCGDAVALLTLKTYARLLGQFLIPYVDRFRPDLLILGGDLARVWHLLEEELIQTLRPFSSVHLYFSLSHEKSICLGAAQQQFLQTKQPRFCRLTDQPLLPVFKTSRMSEAGRYPSHPIPVGHRIGVGHKALNRQLCELIQKEKILLVEGRVGTFFDEYAQELNRAYNEDQPSLLFYDSEASLEKNLSYPCVVIGPAASSVHPTAPLIYIDLPKNELHYRLAAQISSAKITEHMSPVLNRLNYFIDGQRPLCPTWISGDSLRETLIHLTKDSLHTPSNQWSGSYLNPADAENGLLLSDDQHHLLELSWEFISRSQVDLEGTTRSPLSTFL